MGSRCVPPRRKAGNAEYRLLEVVVVQKSQGRESVWTQVMSIDNQYDTLQTVRENLAEFINNMVRAKVMAAPVLKDAVKTGPFRNSRSAVVSPVTE